MCGTLRNAEEELKTLYEFKRKLRWQILLNIFYLIIVLTVLFVILNIVVIFRFVGRIIEGII